MKRFLSFLLAAVFLLTLSPLALAEDSPAPVRPVLRNGHPEDHRPPVQEEVLMMADNTAFLADPQYIEDKDKLNISIQEDGDYFDGVTWTASVSGGSGSYTYRFLVIKPTKVDGETVYYCIARQEASSASFSYHFLENGYYELWVDVTDTQQEIWAREIKKLSIHEEGHDPLSITVSVSGEAFVEPTTWTVNATGGSGFYQYRIYLNGLFPDETADTITYNMGNLEDNSLSYRLLANGDYTLHVWVTDTVNQIQKDASFDYSFFSSERTSVSEMVNFLVAEARDAGCETDYEIALWLHDQVIYNANYDTSETHYGPDGVLLGGAGVCDSYTKALWLLLTEAGIPARRVDGGNHAWIAACLDDEWYYIDPTWDDPLNDTPVDTDTNTNTDRDERTPNTFLESVGGGGLESHMYFCIPDEILTMDHIIESEHPQCVSYKCNYYAQSGDGERWAAELAPNIQSGLQAGDCSFTFPLLSSYSAEWWHYSDRTESVVALADQVALMLAEAKTYTFGNQVVPLFLHGNVGSDTASAMVDFWSTPLSLPLDLVTIEAEAFRGNPSAISVLIPPAVTEIGDYAFADCDGLWFVNIPASVKSFGKDIFDTDNKHLTLYVEKGSAAENYAIQNGLKYINPEYTEAAHFSNAVLAR